MEDFNRELKAGAELFLLYGEEGVGKSRMMRELTRSRLAGTRVHWIEMARVEDGKTAAEDIAAQIESVFESAAAGDIVIADHFEEALKKARHQLFLSWSTDGVDKQINLVVISNLEGFNELRQLSQQYQVRVQSFQQMPFNPDEVDAFLGFYLFPDHPIGKLSMPAPLRRHLAATHGAVGKVIEIVDREGAQIESTPMTDSESIRQGSRILVSVLILFALTVGIGWYYLSSHSRVTQDMDLQVNEESGDSLGLPAATAEVVDTVQEPEASNAQAASAEPDETPVDEPIAVVPDNLLTDQELNVEPGEVDGALVVKPWPEPDPTPIDSDGEGNTVDPNANIVESGEIAEPGPAPEFVATPVDSDVEANSVSANENIVEPAVIAQADPGLESDPTPIDGDDEANSVDARENDVEPGEIAQAGSDPEAEEPLVVVSDAISSPPATTLGSDRFQQLLTRSSRWIESKDLKVGTMQIMLLSHDNFNESVYFKFLDYLENEGIDVDQVRIFKTFTNGREVYSVVYGEYESWQAARVAIRELPDALQKTRPLARSVGGLLDEIEELSIENRAADAAQ